MLGNQPFYFTLLKTYQVYFGEIFKNISLVRTNAEGVTQSVAVPIFYAPEEKNVVRKEDFADLSLRNIAIIIPKMTYEDITMEYDPSRQLPSLNKISVPNSTGVATQFVPVPYNLNFVLNIMTKNVDDANQIIEQILPFFTPEFTSTLLLTNANFQIDVPLSITNITKRDTFEGAPADIRYLIWSIAFRMKVVFFGPVAQRGTILNVNVNLRPLNADGTLPANSTPYENIYVAANTTSNTTANSTNSIISTVITSG